MRIISQKPIRDFWAIHAEAKPMIEEWFRKASQMEASSFHARRQTFPAADYVDGFTIFDVGGNRIAAVVHYR